MNLVDIRAQLEEDLSWRQDELRQMANGIRLLPTEGDRDRFRKAMVTVLYAHYEAYCKTVLTIYVDSINIQKLSCEQVHERLIAFSLAVPFRELERDSGAPHPDIPDMPQDTKLHIWLRRGEFLKRLSGHLSREAEIPVKNFEKVGNLSPGMLRQLLFCLALPKDLMKSVEGSIHKLVNYRHSIAHGWRKDGIQEKDYSELESASLTMMAYIKDAVFESLSKGAYLRVG